MYLVHNIVSEFHKYHIIQNDQNFDFGSKIFILSETCLYDVKYITNDSPRFKYGFLIIFES